MQGVASEAYLQRFIRKFIWDSRAGVNFNDPRVPINAETIDVFYDGPPSKSGKYVNADNALTISAMWRGIAVLCGAASSIPFKVFKPTKGGRQEVDEKEIPAAGLITRRPNRKVTWPVYIDRAINHLHMRGNHFAYIVRNGLGQAVELQLWNPDTVEVFEDKDTVYYKRKNEERTYPSEDVIHVPHLGNGIVGKSVISYAAEDLGLEMSRRDYGSGIYADGGKPPGALMAKAALTDPQREQVKKTWREMKSQGGDVVVPFGFDYQALGFKPEETEFLQAGDFSVTTIARWLGIPPHKLYDLERATFSNIEHQSIEFISDSMQPILVKFEHEYTNKLFQLPIEEFRGYYCEFNMNAYIRADIVTRYEAYSKGIMSGILKPKEGREKENLPFVEGSDRLFINQGAAPIDKIDEMIMKGQAKPKVSDRQKERLKAKYNGHSQEIIDLLNED